MKKIILPLLVTFFAVSCKKDISKPSPASMPAGITTGIKSPALQQNPSNSVTAVASRVPDGYYVPNGFTPMEIPLIAGQNFNVGTVTVWNDGNNLYVAYQTDGDYLLTQTHLFAGVCGTMPVNNSGNPKVGQFPYNMSFTPAVSLYTYVIPLSSFPTTDICVAAHAQVIAYNPDGSTAFSQTGWGQGSHVGTSSGGSWAMQFSYRIQDINSTGDDVVK